MFILILMTGSFNNLQASGSAKTPEGQTPAPGQEGVIRLTTVPRHVAIIMDGNGRWAQLRGLPRLKGHHAGTDNLRKVIDVFAQYGVKYLTLYAFSTENWTRPRAEVEGLLHILSDVIDREAISLRDRGVRLRHLGTLDGLSGAVRARIKKALEITQNNDSMIVSVAFNYGGRTEILEAVRRIVGKGLNPEDIDEAVFSQNLYTTGLPDPDLVIRTGGEMRLSNFLLWQSAYSEYYSTPTFWPDFDKEDIDKALLAYSQRQRRYGGLTSSSDETARQHASRTRKSRT